MVLIRYLASFLLLSLLLAGCTSNTRSSLPAEQSNSAAPTPTIITVFAAASLSEAFTEIGQNFTILNPGVEVTFNFAGSQQLVQQIDQGAPVDLFASANSTQMEIAIGSGRILTNTQQIFAHNHLVVVIPADNPAAITTLEDLGKSGISLIFAAQTVPVGQYSLDFLAKADTDGTLGAGYQAAVLANVVSYEENVRAVLAKVMLGEADAGIVYRSDLAQFTPSNDGSQRLVQLIEIPDHLNTIAAYPIAPLADSAHREVAQQFIDYVLSPGGQQALQKYGFIRADGS
jgi:molybdate transport system substrate-binding protein